MAERCENRFFSRAQNVKSKRAGTRVVATGGRGRRRGKGRGGGKEMREEVEEEGANSLQGMETFPQWPNTFLGPGTLAFGT